MLQYNTYIIKLDGSGKKFKRSGNHLKHIRKTEPLTDADNTVIIRPDIAYIDDYDLPTGTADVDPEPSATVPTIPIPMALPPTQPLYSWLHHQH